jgi:hypothetical protein
MSPAASGSPDPLFGSVTGLFKPDGLAKNTSVPSFAPMATSSR